jgi:uncharacterized protein (TIGR01244 family)
VRLNHFDRKQLPIVGLLVGALLTAPASLSYAGEKHSTPAAASIDLSQIHIDNFGEVSPKYFRGAQPEGRDYADLAKLGVKTLINLTSDDADATEEAMAKQAGMSYLQIPMTTRVAPTPAEIATFLKVVSDPQNQPVYVHCVGGRHRTGVMTAIYRMTVDKWTPDQAFSEMKQYKFGAAFLHPEFKAFVFDYPAMLAKSAAAAIAGSDTPKQH